MPDLALIFDDCWLSSSSNGCLTLWFNSFFEFEAYFDQVWKNIDLKRTNNVWFEQVKDTKTIAWDLSSAFEQEVDKLETKLQEYTDKKALLDNQIAQRQKNIAELNKEIDNLEREKVELTWEKSLPTREMIDKEAIKGIEHAKVSLNLGRESTL